MNITRTDIKILIDLYKSVDGLIPFIFYQRYKYSPATVFKTVTKFRDHIKYENDKLYLNISGKDFIEKNRFIYDKNKYERIPDEFKANRIEINEPYLPDVNKLSKEILNLQNKGDG